MNHLIDFFESLAFDNITSNLEFSTENEQLTITKRTTEYLFYFSKRADIFRGNLCKEIILVTEDNAHLKLDLNNQLAEYLDLKENCQSIKKFATLEQLACPKEFLCQLEEKLNTYHNLNYLYLTLKIKDKNSEEKKIVKKSKI